MRTLICQFWTESERGFGERPDGCTIHATSEACNAFIEAYIQQHYPLGSSVTAPYEYSYPDFSGRLTLKVDELLAKKLDKAIAEGRHGYWLDNSEFLFDQENKELWSRSLTVSPK